MKSVLILLACLGLSACSGDNTGSGSPDNAASTGNKHQDAAIEKMVANNPGMTWDQGRCVVETITRDGQIGIGEVNQLRFDANGLMQNNQKVYQAYSEAVKTCTQA